MVDITAIKNRLLERYPRQIMRVTSRGNSTASIEKAVDQAVAALDSGSKSLVIYGEPQSGKTEMMICLTARLLDRGHKAIVVLVNDSVDLLNQNLSRFQLSGISPTPRSLGEIKTSNLELAKSEFIIFCKKNSKDLKVLIERIQCVSNLLVIDDEADYATPNAKINHAEQTRINELVGSLLNASNSGIYIGVTATPARLDLNNTMESDREKWIYFEPHSLYCGYDVFFPPMNQGLVPFKINWLPDDVQTEKHLEEALLSFMVNVAAINQDIPEMEQENFSFLIHTSGRKQNHNDDKVIVQNFFESFQDDSKAIFKKRMKQIFSIALEKYELEKVEKIIEYIYQNRGSHSVRVINSDTDKQLDSVNAATNPRTPFTVAIGGNIISRGVTFNNLLGMYFTRSPKVRIQQDTYIQRARMFGNRLPYLQYFELHIPESLYQDWHRAFTFHRLALETIKTGQPVWIEDNRVKAVSSSSIDRVNVSIDSGELRFGMFEFTPEIATLTATSKTGMESLERLVNKIGVDYLPQYIKRFIAAISEFDEDAIVIHASSSIDGRRDADSEDIFRPKGLIGGADREVIKYPKAIHHFKIFYNKSGKARLIYRHNDGKLNIRYIKWEKKELVSA